MCGALSGEWGEFLVSYMAYKPYMTVALATIWL